VTLGIDRNTTFARLQERLESREGRGLSLFLIHVSRLRQLNRSLGYRAVGGLLNELEERLMRVARDPERVERIGNADYLVTLDGLMNRGHAQLAALKMLDELSKPLQREDRLYHLDAAIGIWMAMEGDAGDAETVLQQLEWAITEARQAPEKYALWDGEKDEPDTRLTDWDIENDLRQAADRGELSMFYQPQQDLASGEISGAEALIRWRNGDRGYVRPDIFIPIAERSALIEEVTRWTLHTVLREMEALPNLPQISINLSVQVLQQGIVEDLRSALSLWSVDPARVVLEVTESAVISNLEQAVDALRELRALGVGLSIDDFGTGYSTMTYLRQLPATELKIDRSFVDNMLHFSMDEHIVKSLIHMARGAGLRTVAEGVENEETRQRLQQLGCDVIQGYHLARPMPLEDCSRWLEDRLRT